MMPVIVEEAGKVIRPCRFRSCVYSFQTDYLVKHSRAVADERISDVANCKDGR